MKRPQYSWILPIYNEAPALPTLLTEIRRVMRAKPYELIAVDDGSTDETPTVLLTKKRTFPSLKRIALASHQGKWEAMRAGLAKAKGAIVITIDTDLQDDPREIQKLLMKLDTGYDVVSGWRKKRQDDWYKIVISRLGNTLISLLARRKFHDLNAPMKVYRRGALMALPQEGSLLRFSLLFAHKLGYRTIEVPVVHRSRRFGVSKFGFIKYIRILYDLILIQLLFTGSNRLTYDAQRK